MYANLIPPRVIIGAGILAAYGIVGVILQGHGAFYLVSVLSLILAFPLMMLERSLGFTSPASMAALNSLLALALVWTALRRPAGSPTGIAATVLLTLAGMVWISIVNSPRIGP